jgi:hypothetical protein
MAYSWKTIAQDWVLQWVFLLVERVACKMTRIPWEASPAHRCRVVSCRVVSALAGSPQQHTLPWGRSQARRGLNVTGDAYRLFLPVLQVAVLVLLSILSIIDIFIYCTEIFSSLTFQLSAALLACIAGYSNLETRILGKKIKAEWVY